MRTLHRYVFTQILAVSSMTVGLFVFVLVVGNILKQLMGDLAAGRMDTGFFIYLVALIIPSAITYALPLGMLSAILVVFGRMSAQSEIVALKASGQSIFSLASPVLLLAMFASLFSVLINFYYAPIADTTYKSALRNLVRDNPLKFIQSGVFIRDFPGYVIYANDSDDSTLKGLRIWELDKNANVKNAITANKGELDYDQETEEILLTIYDATIEKRNPYIKGFTNHYKQESITNTASALVKLPLNKILGPLNNKKYKLSLLTLGELLQEREKFKKNENLNLTKEEAFTKQIEVQIQIQKNFSMAFSIFSMVLLAIPLGIKASRSETFANLGLALALAMTYYMSTVMISWLEVIPKSRPDILIWIPNIIFQSLGIILIFKSNRN